MRIRFFAPLSPCDFALEELYGRMNENEISKIVVDSAIEVHRELGGPGLLEEHQERHSPRG